jgi:hypothetical protein
MSLNGKYTALEFNFEQLQLQQTYKKINLRYLVISNLLVCVCNDIIKTQNSVCFTVYYSSLYAQKIELFCSNRVSCSASSYLWSLQTILLIMFLMNYFAPHYNRTASAFSLWTRFITMKIPLLTSTFHTISTVQ